MILLNLGFKSYKLPGFQGMDLYFKRHDGQAVTCEDFFAAMRDANDADFANFLLWFVFFPSNSLHFFTHFALIYQLLCRYSQAGTPVVKVNTSYNPEAHTFSLKFRYTSVNFHFSFLNFFWLYLICLMGHFLQSRDTANSRAIS